MPTHPAEDDSGKGHRGKQPDQNDQGLDQVSQEIRHLIVQAGHLEGDVEADENRAPHDGTVELLDDEVVQLGLGALGQPVEQRGDQLVHQAGRQQAGQGDQERPQDSLQRQLGQRLPSRLEWSQPV